MTGPDPAVAAARVAVRHELTDLPKGAVVLVAVSGGGDSLALAAAVAFVAPRLGLHAGAVVVDHQMQPQSSATAHAAASQCHQLGLDPVDVMTVDVTSDGSGPEAAARAARYQALGDAARTHAAAAILVAHTRDDQAETVLLGLARGSGTRALAGMPRRRGLIRRPFLDITRKETTRVCEVSGIKPWQDPHNSDPRYTRVRVRALLPSLTDALGSGVVDALARTAEATRIDADALDLLAEDAYRQLVAHPESRVGTHGRGVSFDTAVLGELTLAIRSRVLRHVFLVAGCPGHAVSRRHVMAVDALITAWHGQGVVALPGGVVAHRRYGRLLIVTNAEARVNN
ncbi:MAG: tRNA lysidine(34) synthetase TilS [Actinomycetota bacterium]